MITNDSMDRSEENFFESNAEVILMGDRQLTDNFRLASTPVLTLCTNVRKRWAWA